MSDIIERCSITELPVNQCAHCRPAPPQTFVFAEPELRPYGHWFEARYGGTCAECGDRFEIGDEIRSVGMGEYACEGCGGGDR